jgi:hypothetical protein
MKFIDMFEYGHDHKQIKIDCPYKFSVKGYQYDEVRNWCDELDIEDAVYSIQSTVYINPVTFQFEVSKALSSTFYFTSKLVASMFVLRWIT